MSSKQISSKAKREKKKAEEYIQNLYNQAIEDTNNLKDYISNTKKEN